ncbi:MAG: hypothetical protein RDU01_06300 [Thermodesulfovibrionales bacterium]|nr:hypothetical protein [Thermodesulfovibrionales bacterium]
MTGRVFLKFKPLRFVAGKTWTCDVCPQLHVKRGMRIRVTGVTSTDLVMLFPRMTRAAWRYDLVLAYHRWMSFVAVKAGDCRLMFCSFTFDSPDDRGMTFNAVRSRQLGGIARKTLMPA